MRAALLCEPGPIRRFAQLRARQMRMGLAAHEVQVVDAAAPTDAPDADFIVTAGNGPPLRAAVALCGDRPLWLDLPGDPFAEAEIAAAFATDPRVVLGDARATVLPALARADAISVISERQRIATEAMLRLLGREVPVHVIPVAMDFDLPAGPPRAAGHTVALLGGFNHWLDEGRLAEVLVTARRHAPVRVLAPNGAIPGHHEAGWARFLARMGSVVEPLGELGHDALAAAVAHAHLTVVVDRDCREATLGSRTRVLLARHLGMRVVATPNTELVTALAAEGQVDAATSDDALVEAIVTATPPPDAAALRERFSRARTTQPLREWVPTRRAPGPLDTILPLVHARDAALAELAALRASPTFRTLDRANRLLRRR